MADDKLNTGPKDNAPPEATAPPGPSDPPASEPFKSPDRPPVHEQAVISGMGKDVSTPAGKEIDLSGIKTAADHKGKDRISHVKADIGSGGAAARQGGGGCRSRWSGDH